MYCKEHISLHNLIYYKIRSKEGHYNLYVNYLNSHYIVQHCLVLFKLLTDPFFI